MAGNKSLKINEMLLLLKGDKGEKGATGAKIVSMVPKGTDVNGGNIYEMTFDDGKSFRFVTPKGNRGSRGDKGERGEQGPQGERGAAGAKVVSVVLKGQDANGGNIYTQTFDDGTTAEFTAPKGIQGEEGPQGGKGEQGGRGDDGVGIVEIRQTKTSNLSSGENEITITLSNGTTTTFTVYNGAKGATGSSSESGLTADDVRGIVAEELAEVNYKPIAINSFYASPSVIEIGGTASITLYWSLSKTEKTQTINGSSVTVGTRSKSYSSVSPNTKYTLMVTEADKKGATDTKDVTIDSVHPFYYGGKTEDSITSVDGLVKSVDSSISGNYEITLGENGYIYFVCHEYESISKITDAETGYGISYEQTGTVTRTISSTSYTYKVYRSVQLKAGTYNLKVE